MDLTVLTPCPGHDLALVPLKHNDRMICEGGATDSGVGVVGHIQEVTRHDMIGNDVGQSSGILIDVARCAGD